MSLPGATIKERFIQLVQQLQNDICAALENLDGKEKFLTDEWQRQGGGGGITRVMAGGNVIEKGGVNTSVVFGAVTDGMRRQLNIKGEQWFAAGISAVLHPVNPFVPTVHFNYRYFELYDADGNLEDSWFGGGTDLTPYYLTGDDAAYFHQTYKATCDNFDAGFYPAFKQQCDDYFVNRHRDNERRGVGGIFYDYQRPTQQQPAEFWMRFAAACGNAFTTAWLPIAEKRKDMPFTPAQQYWQEIRRGRYVEFNLVHDRGTLFGLHSNGRTESILMSLPPRARFDYNYQPATGSEENKLLQVCLHPVAWATSITEQDKLEWASRSNTC